MLVTEWKRDGASPREPLCLCLGFFDGVHLGHRTLLRRTAEIARSEHLTPAVLTFRSSDSLKPGARLMTEEERTAALAEAGMALELVARFGEWKDAEPEQFVREALLSALDVRVAVCGFNYRFGRGASGDGALLGRLMEAAGRRAEILPPALYEGEPVSTTRIRRALETGRPEEAAAMLGRPYGFTGTVYHGKGLGHTRGVPTVNVELPPERVIPCRGVYVCRCRIDGVGVFRGVSNVGVRPTVEEDGRINGEAFLLDYDGDLYGRTVTVELLSFLRPERRFDSDEELFGQIRADAAVARAYFQEHREVLP